MLGRDQEVRLRLQPLDEAMGIAESRQRHPRGIDRARLERSPERLGGGIEVDRERIRRRLGKGEGPTQRDRERDEPLLSIDDPEPVLALGPHHRDRTHPDLCCFGGCLLEEQRADREAAIDAVEEVADVVAAPPEDVLAARGAPQAHDRIAITPEAMLDDRDANPAVEDLRDQILDRLGARLGPRCLVGVLHGSSIPGSPGGLHRAPVAGALAPASAGGRDQGQGAIAGAPDTMGARP